MKTIIKKGQIELDNFEDGTCALWFRTEEGKLLFLGANLRTTGEFVWEKTLEKLGEKNEEC